MTRARKITTKKKASDSTSNTTVKKRPAPSKKKVIKQKVVTPKPLTKQELERRKEQDEEFSHRVWLYKTEVLKWYRYNIGHSDLHAIPARIKPNKKKPGTDTYCYRVWHLNWLQRQINAGNGLELSKVNEEDPRFVVENGPSFFRKQIKGLPPRQLKRLKPCKKVPPPKGRVSVDHWNLCDLEALVQQGKNLRESCPDAPEIRPLSYGYDWYGLEEVDEDWDDTSCACCAFIGVPW